MARKGHVVVIVEPVVYEQLNGSVFAHSHVGVFVVYRIVQELGSGGTTDVIDYCLGRPLP
ncbi:MAG TPA: hypothetical protein VJT49_22180 [Amycolatopsis sp.]|uniref:hypothetical protein n=1 Tax=Amycolatopsis sp. TaxID=37632 RepID=UPI002B48E607|nr:hypothetical protein [Amycolatopsis sp.]HKS47769.1 hypothetical protein [Amycolatopsis sp.]